MQVQKEQLRAKFRTLPEFVQEAILSMDSANKISAGAAKHGLNTEQTGLLASETGLVMMGFVKEADFAGELEKELKIPKEKAIPLAEEISKTVISKIHLKDDTSETKSTATPEPKRDTELKENDDKFHEELDKAPLPQSVKDAIKSVNVAEPILKIGTEHRLLLNEIGEIYEVTKKILFGSLRANEFVGAIEAKLGSETKKSATQIAEEINKNILLKIREAMQKNIGSHSTQNPSQNTPTQTIPKPPIRPNPVPINRNPVMPSSTPTPAQKPSFAPNTQTNIPPRPNIPTPKPNFIPVGMGSPAPRKQPYGTMGSFTPTPTKKEEVKEMPRTSYAPQSLPNEDKPSNREDILKEIENPAIEIDPMIQVVMPNKANTPVNPPSSAKDMLLQKETAPIAPLEKVPVKEYAVDPYREPLN